MDNMKKSIRVILSKLAILKAFILKLLGISNKIEDIAEEFLVDVEAIYPQKQVTSGSDVSTYIGVVTGRVTVSDEFSTYTMLGRPDLLCVEIEIPKAKDSLFKDFNVPVVRNFDIWRTVSVEYYPNYGNFVRSWYPEDSEFKATWASFNTPVSTNVVMLKDGRIYLVVDKASFVAGLKGADDYAFPMSVFLDISVDKIVDSNTPKSWK